MEDFYSDRLFNALERTEPEAGMLLVAAPGMPSPEFARSVVLVVQHTEFITFGVNLVQRSDVAIANVLPEWVTAAVKPQVIYLGGPVQPQSVVGLGVTRPGVDIAANPRLTRLANRLVHLDLRAEPEEIERGDWYVTPALPGDVIAPPRADLWSEVMRRQPMPLPLFSTFPTDLVDN